MRNLLKYYTIIYVLFIIYHKVECTAEENNGTISVTKNVYRNDGMTMVRRNIAIEILSNMGRKFFFNWLPSFTTYVQGRCFGAVRKLQMAFIPLFFKLGVISTMLTFLTAMTAKGLLIGIILLFFNFTGLFAKLYASKLGHQHTPPAPSWHYPQHASGWIQPQIVKPTIKNIHVHVHPAISTSHNDHLNSYHHTPSDYEIHHENPSSLYGNKLASLVSEVHPSSNKYETYQRFPSLYGNKLSSLVSNNYETYNSHPSVYEHRLDDNSVLSDPITSIHTTNILHPDLVDRYDDVSQVSSDTVLTADENAFIERILSKLS